jgi:hypothetical protein
VRRTAPLPFTARRARAESAGSGGPRRRSNSEAGVKLPNFQTSKLPNFQTSKLPNFQTSKLPNFQTFKRKAARPGPRHPAQPPAARCAWALFSNRAWISPMTPRMSGQLTNISTNLPTENRWGAGAVSLHHSLHTACHHRHRGAGTQLASWGGTPDTRGTRVFPVLASLCPGAKEPTVLS